MIGAAEIQAMLDARQGVVAFPPSRITAPPGGFCVPSGTLITGAWPGRNRVTGGSIVVPASPDSHAFVLCADEADPPGNIRLQNIIVRGHDTPGLGHGFVLDASPAAPPAHIEFDHCMAYGVGGDGFHIRHGAGRSIDCVLLNECSSCKNGGHGVYVDTVFWPRAYGLVLNANRDAGAYLRNCGAGVLQDCYGDGNLGRAQFVLDGCMACQFARCVAERFGEAGSLERVGILIRGGRENYVADGCRFLSGVQAPSKGGTSVVAEGSSSPYVGRCFHRNVAETSRGVGAGNVAAQDTILW